jgi:large subunit ribosomal protein L31e
MADAKDAKENEKIFTIPLREAYKKASDKRVPYAARYVRDYLQMHTKAESVKMGAKLNEALWSRGIRKPPRSVRVKAVVDGGVAKAELVGFEYQEFKAKAKKERKGAKERLLERLGPKAIQKEAEEKKIEGKEEIKAEASGEAKAKIEHEHAQKPENKAEQKAETKKE